MQVTPKAATENLQKRSQKSPDIELLQYCCMNPLATYLGGGMVSPRIIARLFSAASILFRMAPWRHVSEAQVLRIDIPDLEVEGACLSVIGGAGESFGLLLFRSVEAYVAFASSPPSPAGEVNIERRTTRTARGTRPSSHQRTGAPTSAF